MSFSRPSWLRPRTVVLVLLGGLFLFLAGWFVWKIVWYYQAIKSGKLDPSLDQTLQSSFSRAVANAKVTPQDLARLESKTAPTLGTPNAKLKIVEFLDYDCPFCRDSFVPVRQVMEAYRDQVLLTVRDFPIEELHPRALLSALAARCAQEQGKYWPYHDKLFTEQENHTDADYQRFAREINLDETKFASCYTTQKYKTAIQMDIRDGLQVGVQGTPTFYFNGIRIQGGLDRSTLELLVKRFLATPQAPE